MKSRIALIVLLTVASLGARPSFVDITWFSIANIYYEIGDTAILTDGYVSRIPQNQFYGGGSGLAYTRESFQPDVDAVRRVLDALHGQGRLSLLLTGHSHFDHSFDTATWSALTGARIIGPKTTCFQVIAKRIPSNRCKAVNGGEKITIADGVTMRVIRWNHSGNSTTNPEQHNPEELEFIPNLDLTNGGLRGGVAEDFPNGGGSRAFLFTLDGPQGRISWFYQNSASAVDLQEPIVINGKNFGAPLSNLKSALKDAGLQSVDLWIGTGGVDVAKLVEPVLKPKAYLPIHWDGLFGAFLAGVTRPYSDPQLELFLNASGVKLIKPVQYMDKWRLDRTGVVAVDNSAAKSALGFTSTR